MKRLISMMLLVGLTSVLSASDVYMKTKTTTSAFEVMGRKQPAREEIIEHWMSSKGMVAVMPARKIVVDTERNLFFMIDDKQKTYLETPLPLDKTKLLPEAMADMMEMMKPTAKVRPTGQTKKIREWNCSRYDVTIEMGMMQMKQTVWATTDVPFDWQRFAEMNAEIAKLQEQFLDEAAVKELLKIEGIQIMSETTASIMGSDVKTVSEVMEISERKAPADLFSIPAGYRKTTQLTPEQLQK